MPKSIHTPPKYRHHKPSGRAVVTLNGRDHYLGKWDSPESHVEYNRLVGEWLVRKGQSPPDEAEHDLEVTELVSRYWRFAQAYYRKNGEPTGVLPGIKVALRFLRQYYGHTKAAKFGPLALKALQQRMVDDGHSRPYLNNNINHIRRAFKWAVAEELVPVSVHQALAAVPGLKKGRTTAKEPARILPVPGEVIDATIVLLPSAVADMVRFHRLVGCRPSEVCLIRPYDVDTKGEIWCYVPESHKTEHHDRERRIYIGPKAQDVLRPYLLRDHESYCFSPKESRRKQFEEMRARRKTPVQPSQIDRNKPAPLLAPGDHYTKDSYNRAIRRAVERANKNRPDDQKLPLWHPNQLRHSVATTVRSCFGIEAAQTVLGHSNADVTQVYAERDFDLAKKIMRKIG